jgi:hypothetical protein
MLSNNASLVLCRYSDEPFNTAERIPPHWGEIPFHLPSLMTFSGLSLLIAGLAAAGLARMFRSSAARRSSELWSGNAS